jgi:hypothetical protein
MTSKEFVIWLKGFTEGVHEYNITPKQWDLLKDKLEEVKDDSTLSPFPFGTPNTTPIVPLPHYPNPLDNPFRVTCSSGSFGTTTPPYTLTTTPGVGSITITNPPFGLGVTSTSMFPISGSNVTYTNNTTRIENDSKEK